MIMKTLVKDHINDNNDESNNDDRDNLALNTNTTRVQPPRMIQTDISSGREKRLLMIMTKRKKINGSVNHGLDKRIKILSHEPSGDQIATDTECSLS